MGVSFNEELDLSFKDREKKIAVDVVVNNKTNKWPVP